jgi:hypothetical protein
MGKKIRFVRATTVRLSVFALFIAFLAANSASALVLNFSNLTGTKVVFSGGTFSFTSDTNGYQFSITSVSDGVGDSTGLMGYVTPGGPFTIGTITTSGPLQSAPVIGTGVLHITDSSNIDLTGSIQWVDITTYGIGGIIDLNGQVNLTGITYTGANSDLSALAAAGAASDVITFQFVPAKTLTQLTTTGGQTSYSGSINAIPEPGTILLVSIGLAGLLFTRRTER